MKKILTILVVLIAVAIGAVYFAGNILLSGLLTGVVGAPVQVQRVNLGLNGGGIYGLVIHNPAGFSNNNLLSIPEASVKFNLGDLFKGKIHLEKLALNMSEVTVERNSEGKTNFMELKVMKKPAPKAEPSTGETKPQGPSKPEKPRKVMPLQIDEVVLNLDKARLVMGGTSKEMSLGVKDETFRDVTNLATLIQQIFVFILKKVGLSQLTGNLDGLLGQLDSSVGKPLDGFLKKLNNI